jgi:hypothetical protein
MAKALKIFVLQSIGLVLFAFAAIPNITHAAVIYLSPSTGTATVGSGFNVVAKLDTNGVVANAVDASITFPANKLQVASISTSGSAVSLWVTSPQYDNANGTIIFTGGQPRPGFNGSSVTLATITFVPIATGSATINATGISVLSGDGQATELLSGLGSATFTLNPAPPPPPPPPPTPPPAPVIIYVPVPGPPAPEPEPLVCPPTEPASTPASTPGEETPSGETPASPGEGPTSEPSDTPGNEPAATCELAVAATVQETPEPANPLQETLWNVGDFFSPVTDAPLVITPVRNEEGLITCPIPPSIAAEIKTPPIQKPIQGAALPVAASIFGVLWLNEKMAGWSAKATKAVAKIAAKKLPPLS